MSSRQTSTRPTSHGQHHLQRSRSLWSIPCILIVSISFQLLVLILSGSTTTQADAAPTTNVLGAIEANANGNAWMDQSHPSTIENRSPIVASHPSPSKRGDNVVIDTEMRLAQGLVPTDLAQWGYNPDDDNNNHNNNDIAFHNNFNTNNYNDSYIINNQAPVPVKGNQRIKTAANLCSNEAFAPAWSGSFLSNDQDGFYPSEDRSCTWTMQAATNGTNPTILAFKFYSPIQLICG